MGSLEEGPTEAGPVVVVSGCVDMVQTVERCCDSAPGSGARRHPARGLRPLAPGLPEQAGEPVDGRMGEALGD